MFSHVTFVVLSLINVIICDKANYASSTLLKSWNNDVYMGRHWYDYMTPTKEVTSVAKTPGVLLLYSPECLEQVLQTNLADWARPQQQFLCFMKHDCERTSNYIWYELDEIDRLCERYNYTQLKCGSYLYFANGSDISTPTEVFHPDEQEGTVNDWMWEKMSTTLTVVNNRNESVEVNIYGRGPKLPVSVLESHEIATIEVYQSYVVVISGVTSKTFVHGAVVQGTEAIHMVVSEDSRMSEKQARRWWKKKDAEIQQRAASVRTWRWGVAEIYLMDFKQTPLLPKFTDVGYKKGTMPVEMYNKVLSWYRDNDNKRVAEHFNVEPAINDSEVKCSMVFLDDDMKKYIGDVMKPYMEEWCNVTLEMTRLYGIREYFHGNILRNHVDRITTHVISVILQIDKELAGAPDWELQVIGFDGQRKNVTLAPGEMLFYESATLIHGRPYPYQGKMFANAFLHYRPEDNWPWSISDDGHYLLKDGKMVEPTAIFATPNTYRRGAAWRDKDEL